MLVKFNAVHRYQLDWLNAASTQLITTNTNLVLRSSSVVRREDTDLALVRVVKQGVVYWISLRTSAVPPATPFNFDANLAASDANRVFVHRWHTPGTCSCLRSDTVGHCSCVVIGVRVSPRCAP
jgi:hypothetical protein